KSISKETTFDQDITDKSVIEETLFKLTAKVCQTMRDENWQTSNVSLKLRYSDFVTLTRAKTLRATDDDKIIFETILDLFRKVYSRRIAVRLVGVHLSKFSLYSEQEFLFDDEIIKRNKMIKAVSQLRGKYGFSAISLGQ
ncbi:MAG: DNA polymerase IV, partial [Methanococcaceae archaeon]